VAPPIDAFDPRTSAGCAASVPRKDERQAAAGAGKSDSFVTASA
jgi:hypothetical protein